MQTVCRLFSAPAGPAADLSLPTILLTQLALPTGRLLACDPLAYFEPQPFTRPLPPGRYPVYLYQSPEEQRVAYAELRLREAEVSRWELALTAGQAPATLGPDEIFGYPVSAGLGCFMDARTLPLLEQHDQELQARLGADYISYYDDYVAEILEDPASPSPDYGVLRPYPERPENVAVFQSGYGDGFYATYLGLDATGQPVRFVTEFIDLADDLPPA